MRETSIQKIVNKFIRYKELDTSFVIFLGAGASVSSGIPTSNGIIQFIKEDQFLNRLISSDRESYFHLMDELDPAERRRIFKYFIDRSGINQTHLITAILVQLGYVDVVITTNFDPLVKKSLNLVHQEFTLIDICNNVSVVGHELELPTVVYLHGEYSNVWQLNTLDELKKNEAEIHNILSDVIKNRSVIILGYSGNDPVFKKLQQFEKFDEGLYWLGYKDEKPSEHVINMLIGDPIKNASYIKGYIQMNFFPSY